MFFPVFLFFLEKRDAVSLCEIRCRSVRDFPVLTYIPTCRLTVESFASRRLAQVTLGDQP
jgi:hypothetical protein